MFSNIRSILSVPARAARRAAGAAREARHLIEVARDYRYTGPRLCTACEGYTTHVPPATYEEWLTSGVMVCPCGYGVLEPLTGGQAAR